MDYQNKIAFITGGAYGAAFGQAQYFGRLGCRIFIVDIRGDALEAALEKLRAEGIEAQGAQMDLMDREAYAKVADQVEDLEALAAAVDDGAVDVALVGFEEGHLEVADEGVLGEVLVAPAERSGRDGWGGLS